MEVACNHCGAKYQFEASAIPADGYDAQCTGCGGVFFVAPAVADSPPISVACVHCGAVYQFPASAIPPAGYDAQCTQCNKVFFVSAQGATPAAPAQPAPIPLATSTPAAVSPTPSKAPASQSAASLSETPVVLAAKKPIVEEPIVAPPKITVASPLPTPNAPATTDDEVPEDVADMVRLANELGDPEDGTGSTTEEDFERILNRRRMRMRVIGIVLGVVVGYTLLTYLAIPRLFDVTLGKLVGIKLTVNPAAVSLMEKGYAEMLADTDEAYGGALKSLDQALAIDQDFPDAIALAALCHIFRGNDIQARGKEIYDAGSRATAEIKAYAELPAGSRPPDAAARVEELRAQAGRAARESTQLFEAGGNEVTTALALLRPAIAKFKSSAIISAATGIYYMTDIDLQARATEMLRMAVELRSGSNTTLDLKNPPDAWTPLLQGLVKGANRGGDDEARAAFEAALKKEPKLLRAKFALAQLYDKQGKRDDARKLATEILGQAPGHAKAKALLARKVEPAPVVAVVPVAPPVKDDSADTATKNKKAKGKRKR
jgi:predicted Zn finger-like uncharacterized protein